MLTRMRIKYLDKKDSDAVVEVIKFVINKKIDYYLMSHQVFD